MYGMGSKSLSYRIDTDEKEAENIINNFYSGFPKVKEFIDIGEEKVKKLGYVEDLWGRKRRLPNAMLPEWEANSTLNEFNPLLYSSGNKENELGKVYVDKIKNCRYKKEKNIIKSEAEANGIKLISNYSYIKRAIRQCTNAMIQGSASTMTKKAMIQIHNDKIMNELGFDLLLTVHDELIGQCPEENAEKVAERLSYLMSNCVSELSVPFKCDAEIEKSWYINTYISAINKEYKDLCKEKPKEEAFKILCDDHIECTEDQIKSFIEC